MANMRIGLLILAALCCFVKAQTDCSCDGAHPQKSFCESDFVIKVKVFNQIDVSSVSYRAYAVKILQTFKADIALRNSVSHNIGLLKVSNDANGCGAVLTANNTYVVSGNTDVGQLTVGPCDWYDLYDDLSIMQLMGLSTLTTSYGNYCSCPIYAKTDENENDKYLCTTPKTPFSSECLFKHGICAKRNGRCQWKVNRDAPLCQ